MGLSDSDLIDDEDGKKLSCSICLDIVTDSGDRSVAKLQCGHEFHLDCIGSAFNIKGMMQCPNCRKIEKGQWLFAYGSRPSVEFSMEEYGPQDEDLYDLSYSEMSFGVHWCPFSGFTRYPSSFDEGEFSSTAYPDLLGQHAIFSDHTAVSSASHPCPYVAYVGPVPPPSSNSSGSVSHGYSHNSHRNSQSAANDIPTSYVFPSMDVHYNSWEQHLASRHINVPDQPSIASMPLRASRINSDLPRSGSSMHPFLNGHGSVARAGNLVASTTIPPYPGSAARARDRVQALQAYFQHPPSNTPAMRTPVMPATRRSNGHQGLAQVGTVGSSSDQASGFYFFPSSSSTRRNFSEAENSMPNHFYTWEREPCPFTPLSQTERDPVWGPNHQLAGVSDTGPWSTSRQRHVTERIPSQYRS